ncbi:hypothetical protein BGW80DRAFT_1322412, partial [Lactifluus volemus]
MEPPVIDDAQAPELLSHAPVSEEIMTIPPGSGTRSLNGRSLQHVPGNYYAMEPHRTKSDDGLTTVVAPAERAFSTTRPSPPSFAQSEFHMIVPDSLKMKVSHSRVPHLDSEWEFAGWGEMRILGYFPENLRDAENAAQGPARGIYSPLCLLTASLNYVYLLQFSGKMLSLFEIHAMPISTSMLTVLFLIALSRSASATAAVFVFHIIAMLVLVVAGIVHWATHDPHSTMLKQNWALRPGSAIETACALFYGVCVAFLRRYRAKDYSAILRNLIIVLLSSTRCSASSRARYFPVSTIVSGANVLWLQILVLIDAVSCSSSTTIHDHILPRWFSLRLQVTGSQHIATLFSSGLSLLLYVGSGMSLSTVSYVFSVAFIFQIFLFAVSSLLLKVNRPRLSRPPHSGTFNSLHGFSRFQRWKMTRKIGRHRLISWYKSRRAARVCIHVMLRALLSVQENIQMLGGYICPRLPKHRDYTSELHPNARLLDEAFPTITSRVRSGIFNPAVSNFSRLDVPRSRMCVISLSRDHPRELAEYGGLR